MCLNERTFFSFAKFSLKIHLILYNRANLSKSANFLISFRKENASASDFKALFHVQIVGDSISRCRRAMMKMEHKIVFLRTEICNYLSRSCRRRQVQGLRGTGRIPAWLSAGRCASSCRCCLHTRRRLRSCVRPVKVARSADARMNTRSFPKYCSKRPDIRHVHCFSSIHSRLPREFPRDEQEKFILQT